MKKTLFLASIVLSLSLCIPTIDLKAATTAKTTAAATTNKVTTPKKATLAEVTKVIANIKPSNNGMPSISSVTELPLPEHESIITYDTTYFTLKHSATTDNFRLATVQLALQHGGPFNPTSADIFFGDKGDYIVNSTSPMINYEDSYGPEQRIADMHNLPKLTRYNFGVGTKIFAIETGIRIAYPLSIQYIRDCPSCGEDAYGEYSFITQEGYERCSSEWESEKQDYKYAFKGMNELFKSR